MAPWFAGIRPERGGHHPGNVIGLGVFLVELGVAGGGVVPIADAHRVQRGELRVLGTQLEQALQHAVTREDRQNQFRAGGHIRAILRGEGSELLVVIGRHALDHLAIRLANGRIGGEPLAQDGDDLVELGQLIDNPRFGVLISSFL